MRRGLSAGVLLGLSLSIGACAGGESVGSSDPGLGEGSTSTSAGPDSTTTETARSNTDSDSGGPNDDTGPNTTTTGTTDGCEPTEFARDSDGDGFGDPDVTMQACVPPEGWVEDATDCDDDDAEVYPGANETCGGSDANCDGNDPPLCNSCAELLASGHGSDTGLYTVDFDGTGGPMPPFQVWCDQETDSGGWTLVQRTVWDPAQTSAMRTGFATWETQTIGNPNPGQGYRLQGDAWPYLNLQLEHMLRLEIRQTDGEACSPLFYLGTSGELSIEGGTATLTGLVSDAPMLSGTELSSTDSGPSQNCINSNLGVPWFYGSCCATCPTYQGAYWNEPHPMANYVGTVADLDGNTEAEVCTGTPQMAINGSSYRGIDAMEYYLR